MHSEKNHDEIDTGVVKLSHTSRINESRLGDEVFAMQKCSARFYLSDLDIKCLLRRQNYDELTAAGNDA